MKTCVIVGQNMPDEASDKLVESHDRTWIFEPLSEAYDACAKKYTRPNDHVVSFACGQENGAATLSIYNRNGLSSSLGLITRDATVLYQGYDLHLLSQRKVNVVNLFDYLSLSVVTEITTLKIDAQGMDLTILKTLEPMLARSAIGFIQCEADGEGFRHYDGLPSNSEEDFMAFMGQFPQYRFEKMPGRVTWNPDLSWILE